MVISVDKGGMQRMHEIGELGELEYMDGVANRLSRWDRVLMCRAIISALWLGKGAGRGKNLLAGSVEMKLGFEAPNQRAPLPSVVLVCVVLPIPASSASELLSVLSEVSWVSGSSPAPGPQLPVRSSDETAE